MSTRARRIYTLGVSTVSPEISEYALQSGNFCFRCVSGDVLDNIFLYDDVTLSRARIFKMAAHCVFAGLPLKSS